MQWHRSTLSRNISKHLYFEMGLMNSRKIDLLADLIKICDFNLQLYSRSDRNLPCV